MKNQEFKALSPDDVIAVSDPYLANKFWETTTVRVSDLKDRIPLICGVTNIDHPAYKWCGDGIEAKILSAEKGGGWKQGRIRLSIEFLPEQDQETIYNQENDKSDAITLTTESSLDDFREIS